MKPFTFQFWAACMIVILIIGMSVLAPLLATFNPFEPDIANRLQGPTFMHFFGTDALGRDMYSRILYGGRASMLLSLTAAVLSLSLGAVIGIVCGYFRGRVDVFFTILCNVFMGIPSTCFMVAIAGILGPSIYSLVLALVITSWAGFSRIVRSEVLQIREEPFMEGLRSIGCGHRRTIFCHICPHLINKLFILFTIRIGRGILSVAGLSFLGLGVQPPTPDWSVMINDAMLYYRSAPHLIIIPGAFIFLLIYAINVIGDGLRNKLDVRFSEVREW